MHLPFVSATAVVAALLLSPVAAAYTPADTSKTDKLAAAALANIATLELNQKPAPKCNLKTAAIRREW